MKIIVGDETGLIKYVSYEENQVIGRYGTQDKENTINFIEFLNESSEVNIIYSIHLFFLLIQEEILTITRQNIIKLYKINDKNTECLTMLNLEYKDLTVGFNRIGNTSSFIVGNEKGQIFKINYLLDQMKFGEMLDYWCQQQNKEKAGRTRRKRSRQLNPEGICHQSPIEH